MLKERIQKKIKNLKIAYTNRKIEHQREKERERRRKGQGRFGKVKLKHSTMGLRSCRYAAGAFGLLLLCVLVSFLCGGEAGTAIGAFGILSMFLAGYGIYAAIKGRKERDKNYVTCRIGGICNGILVLGTGIIFVGGFF